MNPIVKMLVDMARFYSYELEDRQLEMYVDVLSQFPLPVVIEAGRKYVHNVKNDRFPVPVHKLMADYLPKEPEAKDLAIEAAARVREAVTKFGYANPRDAQEYIGELGWRGVQRFGGWLYICENLGVSISPDSFYAQLRDLCKSTLELGGAGIHDQPIGLPSPTGKVMELVNNLASQRSLEGKKE